MNEWSRQFRRSLARPVFLSRQRILVVTSPQHKNRQCSLVTAGLITRRKGGAMSRGRVLIQVQEAQSMCFEAYLRATYSRRPAVLLSLSHFQHRLSHICRLPRVEVPCSEGRWRGITVALGRGLRFGKSRGACNQSSWVPFALST